MKKLLSILFILALPILAAAGMTVLGGGVSPPVGDNEETCADPCVFVCSWEAGSDVLNTGATYVWDSEVDGSSKLDRGTTAGEGWDGENNYLDYIGGNAVCYVEEIVDWGVVGIRFAFKTTGGFETEGNYAYIMLIRRESTTINIGTISLYRNATDLTVVGKAANGAGTLITIGTPIVVSTNTWYQVVFKWTKNTLDGASYEVWNEAGDTQIGATQTGIGGVNTYASNVTRFRVGAPYGVPPSATLKWRMDIVKATSDISVAPR